MYGWIVYTIPLFWFFRNRKTNLFINYIILLFSCPSFISYFLKINGKSIWIFFIIFSTKFLLYFWSKKCYQPNCQVKIIVFLNVYLKFRQLKFEISYTLFRKISFEKKCLKFYLLLSFFILSQILMLVATNHLSSSKANLVLRRSIQSSLNILNVYWILSIYA